MLRNKHDPVDGELIGADGECRVNCAKRRERPSADSTGD
jgi:hypothetical protein